MIPLEGSIGLAVQVSYSGGFVNRIRFCRTVECKYLRTVEGTNIILIIPTPMFGCMGLDALLRVTGV